MNNLGGIIYITGLFGAGKTTLINAALEAIPELRNLPTYITRPLRPGEEDARKEITHVSVEQYNRLRSASDQWDHTEILGTMYGADSRLINSSIRTGQWFIVASPMDSAQLEDMMALYVGGHMIIYIDTDLDIANGRLVSRDGKVADKRILDKGQTREAAALAAKKADIIFKTTGDITSDADQFVSLVCSII